MSTRLIALLVFSFALDAAMAQEATTAAERARRDAENPLRRIIEASKIKPRVRTADTEKSPVAPERVQVRARTAAASETPAESPKPVEPAVAAVVPAVEPAPVALERLPEAPGAAPASTVREVVVAAPPPPAPPPAAAPVAATPPPPLQVTTMVEPVVPRRLLDRVRGAIEVVVTFIVNTDGSVGNVAVQSSTNRLVNPTVLEAVAQWRYAPLAAPREHAVQLVMNAGE